MPGQKMSEADGKKINPKYVCPKCRLLLIEPMQTFCGHLMCQTCIQTLLSSSSPVCPVDGTPLKRNEVFLDAFTKRELMSLNLRCVNSDCDWSGPYKELQNHISICDHALVPCVHEQCKKEIKRSLLGQHLEDECNYRLISCTYCKEERPFISLKEHYETNCSAFPLTCTHCGKAGIPRRDMGKHEKEECKEMPVECDFKAVGCSHEKVVKRKELCQHSSSGLVVHVGLLLNFVLGLSKTIQAFISKMEVLSIMEAGVKELRQVIASLSDEFRTLAEKFTSILGIVTGLERRMEKLESKKEVGCVDSKRTPEVQNMESKMLTLSKNLEKVEEKNRRLENELRERTELIERLRDKLDQIDHSMTLTTVRLSDMDVTKQGQSLVSYNGTLLWKIDNFNRKRQDAVSGVQTAIYSPHFYSSQFGYKMCARIYMNGDGFGKNTHISLFFVVMRGEYDALLTWPFQKKITMMLLDQTTGDHMVDSFRSDVESSSFQRPKTEMNIASGSPLFMPLDGLRNRGYVKDDTIFIKIVVD